MRRDHANLLCIVPILADVPEGLRHEPKNCLNRDHRFCKPPTSAAFFLRQLLTVGAGFAHLLVRGVRWKGHTCTMGKGPQATARLLYTATSMRAVSADCGFVMGRLTRRFQYPVDFLSSEFALFLVFCGGKRKCDKRCTLCCENYCKSTTDS